MNALRNNKSSVDAIEETINECERDRQTFRQMVGNGIDNNGEQTLDALIMDGKSHDVGAVGGLRRANNAITVARYVMENTRHNLLVGDSASDFAHKFGNLPDESLHTDLLKDKYERWLSKECQPSYWENVTPDPTTSCGPFSPNQTSNKRSSVEMNGLDVDEFEYHDTMGLVITDKNHDVAVGTSTTGTTYKIAGRVGDGAIVGSGAYVDNDIGGAVATGHGDILMRFMPSYQTVENMRRGMHPSEAAAEALSRLVHSFTYINAGVFATNKEGDFGGACFLKEGRAGTYQFMYMTGSMSNVSIFEIDCIVEGKAPVIGDAATIQLSKILFLFLAPYLYFYI
ncbi:N(4)-(beta-N-acetylglucosaminyl)-L-asparaginase-like [Glandiceps talaboti]